MAEPSLPHDGITHRTVTLNGINMHIAEKGTGQDVVLFVHGFPDLWYTWRHQITSLACRGYRCVAPDMRGYGGTDAPHEVSSYTYCHVVGDLVVLLDEVGAHQAFVVGHDWGAIIAWWLCLFRPDRVKALVNLSVAFSPRNPKVRPLDALRAAYGDDYYICRFQDGIKSHDTDKEDQIQANTLLRTLMNEVRGLLKRHKFERQHLKHQRPRQDHVDMDQQLNSIKTNIYTSEQVPGAMEVEIAEAGGADKLLKRIFPYCDPGPLFLPKGEWHKDLPPYPKWLSQQEAAYYTDTFTKTGFTGGMNYYRALNLNWELTAPWTGAQVKVPVKFIVGDLDLSYHMPGVKDYIHKGGMKRDVLLLHDVVVLKGLGHFLHQEKPDVITNYIYDFLQKF